MPTAKTPLADDAGLSVEAATKALAIKRLHDAVAALAWYIENVKDDDDTRPAKFFRARETWRCALRHAKNAGIPLRRDYQNLILKDLSS